MKGVHPMETLRFSDFLDSYIQTMPDSMQDGMLYRLTYAENLTRLTFYVTFPQLVPANDLFSLEKTFPHGPQQMYFHQYLILVLFCFVFLA